MLARTAVAAGFEALTIGSHPLADSRGAEDHEGQTFAEVVAAWAWAASPTARCCRPP